MLKNFSKQIYFFFLSYLIAVTAEYLLIPKEIRTVSELNGIAYMSLPRIILILSVCIIILNILPRRFQKSRIIRWLSVYVFAVYATVCLIDSFSTGFLTACILILFILIVFAAYGRSSDIEKEHKKHKKKMIYPIAVSLASAAFFITVSTWTVARVRSFSAPTFDFGIFSQMFYSMKKTGLPLTTVERDGLLSHFSVHISPIYYLFLPFYCLFPHPETLQILQAAVLTSAVIPLWKTAELHGLHPALKTLICILLLIFPSYAGGTSYDLHENCFLTPLILWLMYGIDRKNIPVAAISAFSVLAVKEDAAVYVAVIAIYIIADSCLKREKRKAIFGSILLAVSLLWFFIAASYLKNSGDGIMSYRYNNFMFNGSDSLFSVIKCVFLCPIKVIFECVDAEKLKFIGLTVLPLLFLPFLTRKYERYILLIPYILINLMSDYPYQHDIMFQYTFGSAALLFYLVTVNLADLKIEWSKFVVLTVAATISFGCYHNVILPKVNSYVSSCREYSEYYDKQRKLLDTVPDNASVAATTFYTVYLSERAELYDVHYSSKEHILSCDYVVITVNDKGAFENYEENGENGKENFVKMLLLNGYSLENELSGVSEIYKKISP